MSSGVEHNSAHADSYTSKVVLTSPEALVCGSYRKMEAFTWQPAYGRKERRSFSRDRYSRVHFSTQRRRKRSMLFEF